MGCERMAQDAGGSMTRRSLFVLIAAIFTGTTIKRLPAKDQFLYDLAAFNRSLVPARRQLLRFALSTRLTARQLAMLHGREAVVREDQAWAFDQIHVSKQW